MSFLNTGWRKEDRNFREREQCAAHPHPKLCPSLLGNTHRTERDRNICVERLVTQPPRWRFWNPKYVEANTGQCKSSFCKVANKMKWKSYAECKRHNPNFPRLNGFDFKGRWNLTQITTLTIYDLKTQEHAFKSCPKKKSCPRPKKATSWTLLSSENWRLWDILHKLLKTFIMCC